MTSEWIPGPQLVEAASWRVVTAMLRRYPHLTLIETHPGGGMYDCLSLYGDPDSASAGCIDLNRGGGAHVLHRFDDPGASDWSWEGFWRHAFSNPIRDTAEQLSRNAGLPHVEALPPSSDEVLVYRAMSTVLTATVFDSVRWSARMGYADTSGMGGGPRRELFEPFPYMAGRMRVKMSDDLFDQPGYRFWFLLRDDEPVAAFERNGTVEMTDGQVVSLRSAYTSSDRRIWPVVLKVAVDWLP